MSDTTGKSGKVVEFDDVQGYGYIDYKHQGARVYLPQDQAAGLKEGSKVVFDIEMKGSRPYATNVRSNK